MSRSRTKRKLIDIAPPHEGDPYHYLSQITLFDLTEPLCRLEQATQNLIPDLWREAHSQAFMNAYNDLMLSDLWCFYGASAEAEWHLNAHYIACAKLIKMTIWEFEAISRFLIDEFKSESKAEIKVLSFDMERFWYKKMMSSPPLSYVTEAYHIKGYSEHETDLAFTIVSIFIKFIDRVFPELSRAYMDNVPDNDVTNFYKAGNRLTDDEIRFATPNSDELLSNIEDARSDDYSIKLIRNKRIQFIIEEVASKAHSKKQSENADKSAKKKKQNTDELKDLALAYMVKNNLVEKLNRNQTDIANYLHNHIPSLREGRKAESIKNNWMSGLMKRFYEEHNKSS